MKLSLRNIKFRKHYPRTGFEPEPYGPNPSTIPIALSLHVEQHNLDLFNKKKNPNLFANHIEHE